MIPSPDTKENKEIYKAITSDFVTEVGEEHPPQLPVCITQWKMDVTDDHH